MTAVPPRAESRLATRLGLVGALVLSTAAVSLRVAHDEAAAALAQRRALLSQLGVVRQQCLTGQLPAPIELTELDALFGGERLAAVVFDGACYLTFAPPGGGGVLAAGGAVGGGAR